MLELPERRKHPGLCFVDCSKQPSKSKARLDRKHLRRHVMLAHLAKANHFAIANSPIQQTGFDLASRTSALQQRQHVLHDSERAEALYEQRVGLLYLSQHSKDTGDQVSTEGMGDEALIHPDDHEPYAISIKRSAALPSSGPAYSCGSMTTAETAKWLFCNHLRESQTYLFSAATHHWVDRLWEVARENELILRCVSLTMLLKKGALSGSVQGPAYYAQKTELIRDLQLRLDQGSDRALQSPLLLLIALLAEIESREARDLPAARMHVKALARLASIEEFHDLAWRVAVRVDLRQSLLSIDHPTLPYHIPHQYAKPLARGTFAWDRATLLAFENWQNLPKTNVLDRHAFDLFRNLHQICISWDRLIADAEPPFGHIYNLAYRLRVLHADALKSSVQTVTELVLITMQLDLWIVSRYWTSQIRQVQTFMVQRAFRLLRPNLLELWQESASLRSLVWILATLAASQFDMCDCDDALLTDLLHQVCERLELGSWEAFETSLRAWPWLDNWHGSRTELVWSRLSTMIEGSVSVTPLSAEAAKILKASRSPTHHKERWFLGGLEFYSSL